MFDIGFSELLVIAVVALLVIGPEKLPKVARTAGIMFGRLQRYVNDVKADIKREIDLDELRKLQQNVQTAAKEIETTMAAATHDVQAGARDVEAALNAVPQGAESPATPVPPAQPASDAPPAASTAAGPSEPPRQASLPGFDRG